MLLTDLKRFHDLGFALHWLKPRTKRPTNSAWTQGGRLSWQELEGTYCAGSNIGVRLGKASKIEGRGFLHVLDIDMKSEDAKHGAVVKAALARLFPAAGDFDGVAKVWTGRGHGSAHLYFCSHSVLKPKLLAQSGEKVRVHMPSVKPSKFEQREISALDLSEGWRLRPAWEISLMGEGQQCVLPPSVHPDSGCAYAWQIEPTFATLGDWESWQAGAASVAPTVTPPTGTVKAATVPVFDFEPVDVLALDERTYELVLGGLGSSGDRSRDVYFVAGALMRSGWSDADIVTLLTEREYYLGAVAFDHTKSDDRGRAAEWLWKYTVATQRNAWKSELDFFDAAVIGPGGVERPIVDAAASSGNAPAATGDGGEGGSEGGSEGGDWRREISRNKDGSLKNTFSNVLLILRNLPPSRAEDIGKPPFRYNEFKCRDEFGYDCAFGKCGLEVGDTHLIAIKVWFSDFWLVDIPRERVNEAIAGVAVEHTYHPVVEHLESLVWDGKARLDTWLHDYLGSVQDKVYLEKAGRKMICALVARVYQPGIKFDHVPILEGRQGLNKSTVLQILGTVPWTQDGRLSLHEKDTLLLMQGVWVYELSELSTFSNADTETLKGFITKQHDRFRAPYAMKTNTYPRQLVFFGTTNNSDYLKDITGNRRFWPIACEKIDREGLERDRDQLFAEAVMLWKAGEQIYVGEDDHEFNIAAGYEQDHRMWSDPWVEIVGEAIESALGVEGGWLHGQTDMIRLRWLFEGAGPLASDRGGAAAVMTDVTSKRAARALHVLGWKKSLKWLEGSRTRCWVKTLKTP